MVVERRDGPLTSQDQAAIIRLSNASAPRAGGQVPPPVPSADGRAVLLLLPLPADLDDARQTALVDDLRGQIRGSVGLPVGLTAQVTGGPAFARVIEAAFDGADVTLLIATAIVVAVLLLITYRSPVLWVVPLIAIGAADQVVAKLLPWVARLVGERTDAAVAGIVSVLVFGAGTDYALLLISRYREDLRRSPSRRVPWLRRCARRRPPSWRVPARSSLRSSPC